MRHLVGRKLLLGFAWPCTIRSSSWAMRRGSVYRAQVAQCSFTSPPIPPMALFLPSLLFLSLSFAPSLLPSVLSSLAFFPSLHPCLPVGRLLLERQGSHPLIPNPQWLSTIRSWQRQTHTCTACLLSLPPSPSVCPEPEHHSRWLCEPWVPGETTTTVKSHLDPI